ncbi:MAG: UDP-N-acetylmuramoyl-tripeptide--D-alanyl-D-alanine ligase [Treponema sp.]|jgi:UDP-N-acetylmuramoyl-tripeptide--D-alanyl-D-alanine ligase|nr:UDP-N-acetylmuramoyl-tripeptide--D-alanyl-D-alanine ligase [Treponema sp.]
MTFSRLRAALPDGTMIGMEPEADAGFSSVCIDSRVCRAGALFVCLAGASHDGHQYAETAFKAGAVAALVEKTKLSGGMSGLKAAARRYGAILFAVDNTLRALQDAAKAYLERFPGLLKIGVTGSSGKTTVKEIAGAILSCEKKVVMNKGNLNSETGLPLSVFKVRAGDEIGVFEMGMNRAGEIRELSRVLKPHIALITNIGEAHIGMLGSLEAIAAEKKAIFSGFTGKETALIPASDAFRDFLAREVNGKVVFYETSCPAASLGLDGAELELDGERIRFPLPGTHNLKNALAAVAIAKETRAAISETRAAVSSIKKGLESVKPLFGRSEIIRGRVTLVQDCYNANPSSTAAAIEFCDSVAWSGRRVYVIGSMLELGAYSEAAHAQIGRLLAGSQADFVYLFGAETRVIADILEKSEKPAKKPFFFTENMAELINAAAHYVQEGDLALLKGSRGCALERLAAALTASGE